MARVFVSDCLEKIPDRNELVIMAAKHARTIPQTRKMEPGNWKNRAVEALREIEAGKINADQIVNNWYNSIRPKTKAVVENADQ